MGSRKDDQVVVVTRLLNQVSSDRPNYPSAERIGKTMSLTVKSLFPQL